MGDFSRRRQALFLALCACLWRAPSWAVCWAFWEPSWAAGGPTPHPWIRVPFLCFIQLLRTVPALILALLCTFLVGLGTLAGTLALTFSTFGVMTRLGV